MKSFAKKKFDKRQESTLKSNEAVKRIRDNMEPFNGMPIFDLHKATLSINEGVEDDLPFVILVMDRPTNSKDLFAIRPAVAPVDESPQSVQVERSGYIMNRRSKHGRKGDRYQSIAQLFTGFGLGSEVVKSSRVMEEGEASRFFSHVFAWLASRDANDWFE